MEITKTAAGFAIKFPFALKDAFKEAFPRARWNSFQKVWEVGPKSGGRLEKWAAEVSKTAERAAELEEKQLAEDEIASLRKSLDRIQIETAEAMKAIEALGSREVRLNKILEKLIADREKFEAVTAKLAASKKSVADAEAGIRKLISSVVDLGEVEKAQRDMSIWHRKLGGTAREKFEEAQSVICEHRVNLKKAGWGLTGLDFLAEARFNRPDKDHPSLMPTGAMLDLYKIA